MITDALAWRIYHSLRVKLSPSSKNLSGLIVFSPHPKITFSVLEAKTPAKKIPFYPLLNPLIGESLAAAGDYSALSDLMEKQYPDVWSRSDDDPLKLSYKRQWRETGIRRLTCYFRDNFRMKAGSSNTL